MLTFLWSDRSDSARDLWAMDVESGQRRILVSADQLGAAEGDLPPEETLRRERQRVRDGGITQYQWAKNADRILIPFNGQLYVTSGNGERPRHVAPADSAAVDARLTPDGTQVVFARDRELWVASVETGIAVGLTSDSTPTISNGVAEFIAQEEMGRPNGFWIAPDGARIAYAQVDEGDVPEYPIVHQGLDSWRIEHHRYPFTGAANVRVRLGVLPLQGGPTQWLDLESPHHESPHPESHEDLYLARVDWQTNDCLLVQVESRDQTRLELRAYDPASGGQRRLVLEESETWINLHSDLKILADGRFIWASERSGFKHLSLHDPDGRLIRELTDGLWPVDAVAHVDATRERLYFTAGRESPLERHVYAVSLAGGEVTRLTQEPGFHSAIFAPDGDRFVHSWESVTRPSRMEIESLTGGPSILVHDPGDGAAIAADLNPPELVQLTAVDGTQLYGAIYRPGGGDRGPARPSIVSVYGGPHAQTVTNTWGMTVDMRAQYLCSLGFVVFKLDGRGSARRGLAFEAALKRRFGTVEVEDQVAGVAWLTAQGIADPGRVGIYGWSYGGYLSALCVMRCPEAFQAGVAGAPVADWDGYDTHYTERYMGMPAENAAGYRDASLLTHAVELQGKLMIVHGLVDENVHFRHSARLIAALEQAEKSFDLLVLPEERHGLRPTAQNRSVRRLLEQRVARFFQDNL